MPQNVAGIATPSEGSVQSDKVGVLSVLATRQNEMIAMTVINIAVKVENVK